MRLTAAAADATGVKSVTFRRGATVLVVDTEAPFETPYAVPSDAPVSSSIDFTARALDFADNFADASGSLVVAATPDRTPPTVQLIAPAQIEEGGALALAATAADNVGVASVRFFVNGVQVGTSTAAPYAALFRLPESIKEVIRCTSRLAQSISRASIRPAHRRRRCWPRPIARRSRTRRSVRRSGRPADSVERRRVERFGRRRCAHVRLGLRRWHEGLGRVATPRLRVRRFVHRHRHRQRQPRRHQQRPGGRGDYRRHRSHAATRGLERTIDRGAGSQVTVTAQASDDQGVTSVTFEVNAANPTENFDRTLSADDQRSGGRGSWSFHRRARDGSRCGG